jgi:hypothetical protein
MSRKKKVLYKTGQEHADCPSASPAIVPVAAKYPVPSSRSAITIRVAIT